MTSVLISSVRKGLCDSYQNAHIKSTPDFYEQIGTQGQTILFVLNELRKLPDIQYGLDPS